MYNLQLLRCSLTSLPDLSGMKQLTHVNLQDNNLSGTLPEVFATLPNLESLCIEYNQFSGEIPTSYFNPAGNWHTLILNDNNLSGTISKTQLASQSWKNISDKQLNPQKNGYIIFEGAVYAIECPDGWLPLKVGETKQLSVVIKHSNASNTGLTYTITEWHNEEDPSIWGDSSVNSPFSVDQNGYVTMHRAGNGNIQVKAADGNGACCNIYIGVIE
jgi:hypothetical protein